jgi:GGDEF domain-containing protein
MPNSDKHLKRTLADPETGLHNTLSLRLELQRMSSRAQRYGFPLGLITVTFGPGADEVMPELGRWLAQGIRSADCLARTGPCELRLLLSHEDVEHAPRVMDRLRGVIEAFNAARGLSVHPEMSLDTKLDVEALAGVLTEA